MVEETNLTKQQDNQTNKANQWGMFIHLSILAGYIIPILGLVLPIVLWQLKKNEYPRVDEHGKMALNWILSFLIYFVISCMLVFIVVGVLLLFLVFALAIIFPIIAAIKANQGEVWQYPLTIKFIK